MASWRLRERCDDCRAGNGRPRPRPAAQRRRSRADAGDPGGGDDRRRDAPDIANDGRSRAEIPRRTAEATAAAMAQDALAASDVDDIRRTTTWCSRLPTAPSSRSRAASERSLHRYRRTNASGWRLEPLVPAIAGGRRVAADDRIRRRRVRAAGDRARGLGRRHDRAACRCRRSRSRPVTIQPMPPVEFAAEAWPVDAAPFACERQLPLMLATAQRRPREPIRSRRRSSRTSRPDRRAPDDHATLTAAVGAAATERRGSDRPARRARRRPGGVLLAAPVAAPDQAPMAALVAGAQAARAQLSDTLAAIESELFGSTRPRTAASPPAPPVPPAAKPTRATRAQARSPRSWR